VEVAERRGVKAALIDSAWTLIPSGSKVVKALDSRPVLPRRKFWVEQVSQTLAEHVYGISAILD